ncbi:meiosis protein SPO22/ZIP4 like-domain-containing protein [Echria macrotheca]|uniref:Protein ZIP4 homolog n=1 Tax=Echria macrotheca TaxID=438768 RepID=A0AAJ0BMV3_9PEZI|nr:meiosis protein SPO22/ZIP4 like-domain-containing protein [Echria macrotheca]
MPVDRQARDVLSGTSRHPEPGIEKAIAFAQTLHQILSSNPADAPVTHELVSETKKHIDALSKQTRHIPGVSGEPEVDSLATRLWNVCARLGRDHAPSPGKDDEPSQARLRGLFLHGRVLAFYILTLSRVKATGSDKRIQNAMYLLRLALKLARDCLGAKELDLAVSALQKAADYKGVLQDVAPKMDKKQVEEGKCLEVEYFTMRTALASMENRLDVAEHVYTKAETLKPSLKSESAERFADVLFEIGKSLSGKEDFALAVKWLQRANDIINGQSLDELSREGVDLRLAILQALVTALLGTGTSENLQRAKEIVDFIESEVGRKLVVSLLRLELLHKTPSEEFDSDAYGVILRRIVREFNYSDAGFKLIMHHIRKLHAKSPAMGCIVLDEFIIVLVKSERDDWMEKAVVTRTWMIINQRDTLDTIDAVHGVLSHLTRPLSAEAAVAAQALIWKKIESNYGQGGLELAASWCRLSLHEAFQNCGPGNTAKLERKLVLCALSRNALAEAATIIQGFSPQTWKEPITAYLGFKVAIRLDDQELANQCISTVATAPEYVNYLGACISESQQVGDIRSAIAALKKLQERYDYGTPNNIHLPALFRCAIRLLNLMVDKPGDEGSQVVNELCGEFEAVVVALERQKQGPATPRLFDSDEIEWFGRNSYNLALKNIASWDLRDAVRMLTSCVGILGHFPSDAASQLDLGLKCLFCRFILSSILVSLARTEDNVDQQRNHYAAMREHINAFDVEFVEHMSHLNEDIKADLAKKQAVLLAFDFEGAMALEQWDDLGGIVQRAAPLRNITAYQAMADNLLRGKPPGQVLYSTMRKLVNEIWVLEAFDAAKLAKYTRCLFQATLPLDDGLAIRLLDEACSKARELREGDASWPEDELEWMATTAFNHAIDCYGVHEVERAKEWAARAINLAHYCGDEGGLERTLQERYLRLDLDGTKRRGEVVACRLEQGGGGVYTE